MLEYLLIKTEACRIRAGCSSAIDTEAFHEARTGTLPFEKQSGAARRK